MKIFADENIPYAKQLFGQFGEVQTFAGRSVTANDIAGADVLLVRSITKVNEALLAHSPNIQFVGTATIGEDHIDKAYLNKQNIEYTSAPGCNAVSVAEYVIACLCVIEQQQRKSWRDKTVAVIGYGNIGKALVERLKHLAVNVLVVDPFETVAKAPNVRQVSIEQALTQADIISFHTPLTKDTNEPTFHLLNQTNIGLIKQDATLINASRGEVIDNKALLKLMKNKTPEQRKAFTLVLDVWENEPNILTELIDYTTIATAHIAGYSLEGKANGTQMLADALAAKVGIETQLNIKDLLPTADITELELVDGKEQQDSLNSSILAVYDPRRDDKLFREHINGLGFDWLRKNYPIRRQWQTVTLNAAKKSQDLSIFSKLGFDI